MNRLRANQSISRASHVARYQFQFKTWNRAFAVRILNKNNCGIMPYRPISPPTMWTGMCQLPHLLLIGHWYVSRYSWRVAWAMWYLSNNSRNCDHKCRIMFIAQRRRARWEMYGQLQEPKHKGAAHMRANIRVCSVSKWQRSPLDGCCSNARWDMLTCYT